MALKLSVIFDGKNQKLKQATNQSVSDIERLKDTAKRATAIIGSAYAAATSARALLENQKMIDRWGAQMRVAAGGTEEARVKMGELNQMADETGTRIDELVLGFTRLSNLGLKPSEEALLSYMNTSRAMGKSLEQFIEAVADASVAEFERLKDFGIKARNEGETIKFTFQGITTEVANSASAIQDYLIGLGENQFAGIVDEQADQVEAALNRMNNQWIETLQTINEGGIGDAMKASIQAGTEALGYLTEVIQEDGETIVDVGLLIASVFGARMLGSVAATTQAFLIHQAAQTRVIARYAAMNGITRMTAHRLVAVGAAARGASFAMGLLGGPIGVVALAASALFIFADDAGDKAEKRAKSLQSELEKLRDSFEGLTLAELEHKENSLQMKWVEASSKIAKYRDEIEKLEEQLADPFVQMNSSQYSALKDRLDGLKTEYKETQKEQRGFELLLEEIGGLLLKAAQNADEAAKGVSNAGDASDKAAKQFAKVTDKLAMQMVELSLSEDSWERYQILQEAGTNLTEDQIASLDRLIARIRELRQAKEDELNVERQRQAVTSNIGSLSNQLMPQQSEMWQHRTNMSHIDQAIQDPSLAETMPGESEVEKLARLNALKELEMQRHTEAMAQINGDMTAQIDAMWSETFDRFAAGIGDAVATSIMEGQNFGEVMQNLARSVLKTVISGLVEIGVKRLLLAGIEQSAAATTAAANIAAGTTTAVTLASVWTPAAAMVSLATMGGNSAGAIAGMTATMTAAQGLSLAGMAHDGIGRVPESHEGTWMLRKDEMVLNPAQRENFEFLVDHIKRQNQQGSSVASGGSGGTRIEIFNEFKFEGGAGGNREEVEQAVTAANERFKAELIDDFSSGGRIYQTLRAKGG
ncbi:MULTISPECIES: hypothetical protein [Idiomarina]|uniref:hypothetical protein n=1 Tax=Idiomarina TaxID=135575 RepID=UPI00129BCCA7|nr:MULTISPECIES: hypothetical protein [Idiomarina]MRJ40830.1 hypothetical protein [Idiomarina sp. FeN1]NCU56634.1 hypothetical protein [Idiomarina sp. FenA--70]NCU59014.1 hypothetical protein [Idiomarina sp. FenBw--71]UUN14490.1 hypothetical protein KGF88_04560 [Idiomarina loihiensis]